MTKLSGSQYQCIWCRQHFAGPRAYGLHYSAADAQCMTPDEMRAAGYGYTAAGFWAAPPATAATMQGVTS